MLLIGTVIGLALSLYEGLLLIRVVLSWVQAANREWTPRGIVLVVSEFVYTLTDPPVKLSRRLVKPIRIGNIALDLSVIVVFFLVILARQVNQAIFFV
ncbi:MAG: YggT family protein [Propionibacteriaceae bacterium]|jgi:YggT family protein|nr:YggT family protein [Propionibacteriaceae bacterium]